MKKIKKLVITSAAIALLTSGMTYQLCQKRNDTFDKYLKKYQMYQDDDLLICAHRGYSSLEVENTEQAIFLASGENYIDCIEIDARMTKDGKIVLSHDNIILDNKLEPVIISNSTYDELMNRTYIYQTITLPNFFWYDDEKIMINSRNRDLNSREYKLISLEEGIQSCGDKFIIVDLKFNNNVEEFTEELKKELVNIDNIVFQSFNIGGLIYLQEHSDFECMPLIDSRNDLKYINRFKRVSISKSIITSDLMKEFVDKNIKVAIWTINNTNEINDILDKVGDYYKIVTYITNYPDLILTRINEKRDEKRIVKKNI